MHEYSKAHAASSSSSGKPSQSSSEACGLHAPHGGMSEGMSERWFNGMSDTYVGRVCRKACREGMSESGSGCAASARPQASDQGDIKSGTRPCIYRRLGGKKPGNLNGSCVRDPVAGDYFVISPPARARAGRALGVGA